MVDRVVGEEGPAGNRTTFTLTEYEGHKLFDIRKYYFARGSGEFKPTRKGISLNRDTFMELCRVLNTHKEDIIEYLAIGHIPEGMLRYQQANEEAKQKNFRLANEVEIEEVNMFRDEHLFHVQHQGGKDIVQLNLSHPFAKAISESEIEKSTPEEIRHMFASMIAAFARARSLLLNSPASSPEILFDHTEFDWSSFLRNYVEET